MIRPRKYQPKRVDKNQPEQVKTLRRMGFIIRHLHEVGEGVFDLMVEKHRLNIFAEIKNGEKPPSARKFTPPQKEFNDSWRGLRCVLTNFEDCVRLNESVNRIADQLRWAGITLEVFGCMEDMYKPSPLSTELST